MYVRTCVDEPLHSGGGMAYIHTCMDINTYCFQRGLIISYQLYTDYFHELHIVFN